MLLWSYLIVSLTDRIAHSRCSVSSDCHTNSKLFLSSLLFLLFFSFSFLSLNPDIQSYADPFISINNNNNNKNAANNGSSSGGSSTSSSNDDDEIFVKRKSLT